MPRVQYLKPSSTMQLGTSALKRATLLFVCVTLLSCSKGASEPSTAVPIRGRVFNVTSVGGRAMPTTIGIISRGACEQQTKNKITLTFNSDSSFVASFESPSGTSMAMNNSFTEPRVGQLAVLWPSDSVFLIDGTLHTRLGGVACAYEEIVALPR